MIYVSTCDFSPNGNPEKYGRPIKSAIEFVDAVHIDASPFLLPLNLNILFYWK